MTPPQSPERWPRIERLLDAALDLPADRRAEFLDGACADDPELRGAVEGLLDACEADASFLGRPSDGFVEALLQTRSSGVRRSGPIPIGERVGPYRVLEEAGRGGMAVFYLAGCDDGASSRASSIGVVCPHPPRPRSSRRYA